MISVRSISKNYGPLKALKDITLSVDQGEIFGLIGPDGAGKTTLIRILTTLLLADSGEATVLGKDVVKDYKYLRSMFGYMPGRFSLYEDLTVEENLQLFASIFGTTVQENYHLIKDIYQQIEPFKNRRAGKLSGGMKQKLALSCAMIHKPEVIFLDEPTTGVDPVSRKEFWHMLRNLKENGITVFVSTPYMDEASLCDRIALIQDGSLLSVDTPQGVVDKFHGKLYAVYTSTEQQLLHALRKYHLCGSVYLFGECLHYSDKIGSMDEADLKHYLIENGLEDVTIRSIQPVIEDCFMALMVKKEKEVDHVE